MTAPLATVADWLTPSLAINTIAAIAWIAALITAALFGHLGNHPAERGLANISGLLCSAFAILAFTLQVIA